MTTIATVFAINVLTSLLKKFVMPKFGVVGVQVVVFALALGAAVYFNYGADYVTYVKDGLALFAMAVAIYEVVLKRLAIFKKGL